MTIDNKLRKIVKNPILYMQNFMKIVDKNGRLVKFKLNPQQKELFTNLDKYNVILKSRQLGITSVSCAYSVYLTQTQPNTTCLLVSYSIDSATAIFEKLKQLYNDLPEVLKVPLIANNKKELRFINGSRITVSTCGNKDVARGQTLHFVHLSEVGFMKDTVTKQLLAIEQCLVPNGKIILESTANGLNHFSEIWGKAERGDSMYRPHFFNWCEDKVMFKEEYKMFCDRYIKLHGDMPKEEDLDDEEKSLLELGADLEQLVWRRMKIANSDLDSFKQEFPSTALEAFLMTSNNVFDSRCIQDRLNFIHTVQKITTKPSDLPAVAMPYFNRELTMYKTATHNDSYYFGVDCSEGVGGDYSAIEVVNQDCEQVMEFKSNTIKPFEFTELIHDLAIYYNKAYLVIEKASSGHSVLDKLKNDYRYSRLHKHKEYDARGQLKRKVGFVMNPKTKPMVINNFVELFMTNQMLVNSKDLLGEMKLYCFEDGKMNASRGYHDDLVIAMALALDGVANGTPYA
jgi:hypothetical protein